MILPKILARRHVVYRLYADDRLLYIGASSNIAQRIAAHRQAQWWFQLVTKTRYDCLPSAEAARAAEAVAIQEEQPAFNVQHTGRGPGSLDHWTDQDRRLAWDFFNADRVKCGLLPYRSHRNPYRKAA